MNKMILFPFAVLFLAATSLAWAALFTYSTNSPQALAEFDLAIEEIKVGNNLQAFNFFYQASQSDSSFAIAYLGMALVHPTHSREQAAAYFQEALKYKSKTSPEEQAIIDAVNQSDLVKIVQGLHDVIKQFPDEPIIIYSLGQMQFSAGKYLDAVESFEHLLSIESSWYAVNNSIGYCYLKLNQPKKAEKAFKTQIEKLGGNANSYDSMGEFYLSQKRYAEAIKLFQFALIKDNSLLSSHKGLAKSFAYIEEFEKAVEHFSRVYGLAETNEQKFDALMGITTIQLAQNNVPAALSTLKQHCKLAQSSNGHDELCRAVHLTGEFYFEIGKLDEAEKIFKKDIELRLSRELTDNWRHWYQGTHFLNLGLVALKRGELQKAKELANRQLELDMENPEQFTAHRQLIFEIAMYEKHYENALDILETESQDYPHGWRRLARVYEAKGDYNTARTYWQKIVDYPYFDNYYAAYFRHQAKAHLASL